MQVSPPRTIMGSQFTPKLQSYNINQISTQGALLQRPAAEFLLTSSRNHVLGVPTGSAYDYVVSGDPRGTFEILPNSTASEQTIYGVWGDDVYRHTYVLTSIVYEKLTMPAVLGGTGRISSANGNGVVAFCGGGKCFYITDADIDTPVEITDVDLPDCVSVSWVDGRFVWTPTDGSPLIYSDVNDVTSYDALSFFDAETLTDLNAWTVNLNNDLFVLGTDSIERFRNIGSAEAPFLRVNNSIISVGYVAGAVESKDSFLFLGKDKGGGYAFFMYSSGRADKISSSKVTEDLNLNYTIEELLAVHGQRFNWGGVDCYVWTMSDKDYLFNVETGWSYVAAGTTFGSGLWGYGGAIKWRDVWYAQGARGFYELTIGDQDTVRFADDSLESVDPTATPFIRGFQLSVREPTESVFTPSKVDVGIEHTTTDSTLNLSVSHDGSTWSTNFPQTTGTSTENKLVFNPMGGLGLYDGYLGVRVSSTDNVALSIENLNIT